MESTASNPKDQLNMDISAETFATALAKGGAGSTAAALADLSSTVTVLLLIFFFGAPPAEQWRQFVLRLVGKGGDDP